MINSAIVIVCEGEGCKARFTAPGVAWLSGIVMRRDIENARAIAKEQGWAYRRLVINEANRDLCPDCDEKLVIAKARRRRART